MAYENKILTLYTKYKLSGPLAPHYYVPQCANPEAAHELAFPYGNRNRNGNSGNKSPLQFETVVYTKKK